MAGKAVKSVAKAVGEYRYPWREKLTKYRDELSKGVWGYWELGAWKPLAISARHRARIRKEVLLAGGDWEFDPKRKEMKTKRKGHKVDRLAAEKQANTARLMEEMPKMLDGYRKRRWEKKMKEEEDALKKALNENLSQLYGIILDVKCLLDLLWGFPLDHVSNCLACQIQKALDIEYILKRCQLGKPDCAQKLLSNIHNKYNRVLEILYGCGTVEVQGDKVRRRNEWNKWLLSTGVANSDSGSHPSSSAPENVLATSLQEVSLDAIAHANGNVDASEGHPEMAAGQLSEVSTSQSGLANGDNAEEVHSMQTFPFQGLRDYSRGEWSRISFKDDIAGFHGMGEGETEAKKDVQDEADTNQPSSIALNKRFIEKLENLGGMRSPTSRH
ncbi:tyrosine sulfotransferase-like protein [Perilla frutescens var. hirtella]|uniref:Tyrosine sulfotransferase-like protein n=1 Tax=Perilla frutescens var. hirtella TaxID=608512 RepID=A0AAD4PDL9_PERFH|nr:tyrosine sulfotransferase-like protein [Perilla frutescens var. hirtella]